MSNDIRVPKEQFLIDLFDGLKSKKAVNPGQKQFSEVLSSAQLKIEKSALTALLNKPAEETERKIDNMGPGETVSAVKESVDILRRE